MKGTRTINAGPVAPQVGTVNPPLGSSNVDAWQTFTTTYSDANGWQNIQCVRFTVNTTSAMTNCLSVAYNQNVNKVYLRGNDGVTLLGGVTPGTGGIVENSYANLDPTQTTVTYSGNTLTINWRVAFKSTFTGVKNMYLQVYDDGNLNAGPIQKGTWAIN